MRKIIASLGTAAMLSVMPVLPAAPANAATIIKGQDCTGKLFDENGVFYGEEFTGSLISRTTKSGITTTTCHFNLPDGTVLTKSLHTSGFPCYIGDVQTNDTRASISPGGRMVLTCRLRT
jgi:hypothetical protein